jgi:hypothetical protein
MRSLEDAANSFQGALILRPGRLPLRVLAGAIFWADAFTRLGSAIATLYVLVLSWPAIQAERCL